LGGTNPALMGKYFLDKNKETDSENNFNVFPLQEKKTI
jgi:hypothetical protein